MGHATVESDEENGAHPSSSPFSSTGVDSERNLPRSIDNIWSSRIVLCLDGRNEATTFSALFVLEKLVEEISGLEKEKPAAASSSFSPLFQQSWAESLETTTSLEDEDDYLLCHYFDYITGTGIASISAVMLSTMRLSVGRTLELTQSVWHGLRLSSVRLLSLHNHKQAKQENLKTFRRRLEVVLGSLYNGLRKQEFEAPPKHRICQPCQTVIFATQTASRGLTQPVAFRSYQAHCMGFLPGEPSKTEKAVQLWDALCASSASPAYFSKIEMQGLDGKFMGSSSWRTDIASDVFKRISESRTGHEARLEALLSIGPTEKRELKVLGSLSSNRSTNYGEVEERALRKQAEIEGFKYTKLESIGTYELKNASKGAILRLRERVRASCDQPEQKEKISAWARRLVDRRRLRARTVHWETFAELKTSCRMCEPSTEIFDRTTLQRHLKDIHQLDLPVSERM